MNWLRRAFALDEPGELQPSPEQARVIDRVCREVVRRGMATPALVSLEVFRPMNYIGSQALHFFRPIATVLLDEAAYSEFAEFLAHRSSVDYLRRRIEDLEAGGPEATPSGVSCPDSVGRSLNPKTPT